MPGLISSLAWLLISLYALARGEQPERLAGVACLVGLILQIGTQDRVHWIDPERRMLAIDTSLLLIFVMLLASAKRPWLLVATAAQFLTVALHFDAARTQRLFHALAYLHVEAMLSYIVIGALFIGVFSVRGESSSLAFRRTKASPAEADEIV
jgi:sulfite exporter TauE/SafE